ncbi:MAG: amidohydrolase [Lachnospiraceae bacterium]|nr:amidohydrolase [Lachnospiraceae bacterium]
MNEILKTILLKNQKQFEHISDMIWEYAETRYQEYRSADLLENFLDQQGFSVEKGIGDIPTAFCAKFGSGHPVIAFLGEYDALPGLSQKADTIKEEALTAGGAGHGCGHNLLGAGSLEAACALKTYIEQVSRNGTVIYYGCPAEESGAGKAFMLRAGCFQDVDFALTWHPFTENGVWTRSLTNVKVNFHFSGRSSHASADPQNGRSALDACELMNVGVNYLREHVPSDIKMHYAYLNSGGTAPNIIPAHAELLYALRAEKSENLKDVLSRVSDIAKGAALMTGTRVDMKIVSAYREILNIPEMEQLLLSCMKEHFPISYTRSELEYAEKFNNIDGDSPFSECISRDISLTSDRMGMGSTDVGDISWNIPTGIIYLATMSSGTTMHSWTAVAQGKSSVAYKGMHTAASILAEAGRILLEEKTVRTKIQDSFAKATFRKPYYSLIPKEAKPDI